MKKIATILFASIISTSTIYAQVITDDFESYTVGQKVGFQSSNWDTYTFGDTPSEDIDVVSTDNNTTGGSKSLRFTGAGASGGPGDLIFNSGSVKTSGYIELSAYFKIPTGKNAYFNFIGTATPTPGHSEILLNSNGHLMAWDGATKVIDSSAAFPFDTWFKCTLKADLTANQWSVYIDDLQKGATWTSAANTFSLVDFYMLTSATDFWLDDVYFLYSAVGEKELSSSNSISLFPNPSNGTASLTLELSTSSNVQVDIYQINGSLVVSNAYTQRSVHTVLPVDLSAFNSGIYFIKTTVNGESSITKFIKQ